jgi:hypothetical protein
MESVLVLLLLSLRLPIYPLPSKLKTGKDYRPLRR